MVCRVCIQPALFIVLAKTEEPAPACLEHAESLRSEMEAKTGGKAMFVSLIPGLPCCEECPSEADYSVFQRRGFHLHRSRLCSAHALERKLRAKGRGGLTFVSLATCGSKDPSSVA